MSQGKRRKQRCQIKFGLKATRRKAISQIIRILGHKETQLLDTYAEVKLEGKTSCVFLIVITAKQRFE